MRAGEAATGALVVPADVIQRLQGTLGLGGGDPPTVEVYYAADNALKRRYVEDTIEATLADANKALSDEIFKEAAGYLNLIVAGGSIPTRSSTVGIMSMACIYWLRTSPRVWKPLGKCRMKGSLIPPR